MTRSPALVLALGAAALLACAHEPGPLERQASARYAAAAQDPEVKQYASVQLYEAQQALERLEGAARRDAEELELEHRAHLVQQRVEIARVTAEAGALDARAKQLAETRNRLQLRAREQDTRAAENRAAAAEDALTQAEQRALDAREEAHQSQLDAAETRVQAAEQAALDAEEELMRQTELLHGQRTDRGLLLTLSGGMFAVDGAELQPGALRELDRIADFLERQPQSELIVEGHTDDQGDTAYNLALSERRARAVADHLIAQGVAPDRMRVDGFGESRPIAPNDTPAGRQQNRRVEVLVVR
jgi:outer membrane protein OmpA-like peptidoglycan-associated protein